MSCVHQGNSWRPLNHENNSGSLFLFWNLCHKRAIIPLTFNFSGIEEKQLLQSPHSLVRCGKKPLRFGPFQNGDPVGKPRNTLCFQSLDEDNQIISKVTND